MLSKMKMSRSFLLLPLGPSNVDLARKMALKMTLRPKLEVVLKLFLFFQLPVTIGTI